MSLTFESDTHRDELIEFLAAEYQSNTGIPVHLYSVVNATFSSYNKSLAITDGATGTIFLEDEHNFKSYGNSNPIPLMCTLNQCGGGLRCVSATSP